jgi:hypothetical protein
MQYDLNKVLEDKKAHSLTWHGADTLVRLSKGDASKTEVKTGETIDVSTDTARSLLRYSDQWTFEGDTPTEQPYRAARAAAAERMGAKRAGEATEAPEASDVTDLSPAGISKMLKADLVIVLTEMEVEMEGNETVPMLKDMLLDAVEGATEDAEGEDEDSTEESEA